MFGLGDGAAEMLYRSREREKNLWRRRWFRGDVPLLDELLWLLGDPSEATEVDVEMEHEIADADDVFTLDEARGDDPDIDGDDEDEETLDPVPGDIEIESFEAWRDGEDEDENDHKAGW